MAHTKSILYYSLLSALITMPFDSYGAVKISNKSRSYADAYNTVNDVRASVAAPVVASAHTDDLGVAGKTEFSSPLVDLPIYVANSTLASQIARGDSTSVTYGQLEKCAAVYPNGEFSWDNPTAGTRGGTGSQCTAIVEMRGYQMGPNGSDLVLARVNIAAGDAIKCNISAWPEHSYLPAAGTIEFPPDTEPTIQDVTKIMNQEQKQHAGLKIAAGTVLAAVAGNALGAKEAGSDAIIGTNREKLRSTAIGGLTGAAIMAGNVYGGAVGGEMILSAGVNAAAGGLIGNMAASGDSVMRVENCNFSTSEQNAKANSGDKCLWGMFVETKPREADKTYFFDIASEDVWKCETDGLKNCTRAELVDIMFNDYKNIKTKSDEEYDLKKIAAENYTQIKNSYSMNQETYTIQEHKGSIPVATADNRFVVIDEGDVPDGTPISALVKISEDKPFGYKEKHWKEENKDDMKIWGRDANGQPFEDSRFANADISKFRPLYVDSEDGGLIDLNNKARLKGTLIGAGAGGALGAFTAYQGAQEDIQQRWVAAVREYKDSLQKVYCATGGRFLTQYNDMVVIPNASE